MELNLIIRPNGKEALIPTETLEFNEIKPGSKITWVQWKNLMAQEYRLVNRKHVRGQKYLAIVCTDQGMITQREYLGFEDAVIERWETACDYEAVTWSTLLKSTTGDLVRQWKNSEAVRKRLGAHNAR